MALSIARLLGKNVASIGNLLGKEVSLTGFKTVSSIQVATLRTTFGEPFGYKEPYDYKNKKLNLITEFFDLTKPRMNENSKIILIDGPIAVGKNKFGEKLAQCFDLRFYPSVQPERAFIEHNYGSDLRNLNDIIPKSFRFYDLDDFYTSKDLKNGRIGKMLLYWYINSACNYCSACLHMLSTGQGVVLANSCFKDIVYIDTMHEMGYISTNWHTWISTLYKETIVSMLRPHLAVYLHAPIEVVRQRINKRGKASEVNSSALSDEYLKRLEHAYRTTYHKQIRRTGEVVELDWTEVGNDNDIEAIADSFTSICLENTDNESDKFWLWRHYSEDDLAAYRRIFCRPEKVYDIFNREMPYNCPEIMVDSDDVFEYEEQYMEHPVNRTLPGDSTELGHNTYFKF